MPRLSLPRLQYTLPGLTGAFLFALVSLTPSLLPRAALFQGFVTGISAAIGYGLGVLLAWLWRAFANREIAPTKKWHWRTLGAVALVGIAVASAFSTREQNEIRELMGTGQASAWRFLTVPLISALIFIILIGLGRALRRVSRWLGAQLTRVIGPQAAKASAVLVVSVLTFLALSGLVFDNGIEAVDSSFALGDVQISSTAKPPTSEFRSGSEASIVKWEDLGRQGRRFVGLGPTAAQIAEFTGRDSLEPIRAYAGTANAEEVEDRAALAVDDLERAGGFERGSLLVAGSTGSGFIEPSASNSFEYLTGGDSAIVSIQYSHLPSWASFLVDQTAARNAGRALFDEVYERWLKLPVDSRPKLYVFGESLGSFAMETAFSGEADLRNRTSGALLVGPPNFNELYTEFRSNRDAGSREIEPVFRDGRTIRFANNPWSSIPPSTQPWNDPRMLYLVHPSDPITWWSPDLIWHEPDWLKEQRGDDVSASMRWYPIVTFWQTSADMAVAMGTPPGHGHNFVGEHVAGWAQILQPAGWTEKDLLRLQDQLVEEAAEFAGVPPSLQE